MLTDFENKSMTAAPDIATLRERAERLRAEETRQERQLHAAKQDLTDSETAIANALFAESKGYSSREALTAAMLRQGAAQKQILDAMEVLSKTRAELREANEALLTGEARAAEQEAAALELEIITELRAFAGEMLNHHRRCEKIQALRERAREVNHRLFSPGVIEALGANWGEIVSVGAIESRLELIGKCVEIPEEAAAIIRATARERSLTAKAEIERGRQNEAERKRGGKLKVGYSCEIKFDEEGKLVSQEIFDY